MLFLTGHFKAQCLAPEPITADDKRKPLQIPIEEKKTFVWIEHYRDLVALASTMPQTRLIDEQRNNPGVDVLTRAINQTHCKPIVYILRHPD